jgi:hypothetical protein
MVLYNFMLAAVLLTGQGAGSPSSSSDAAGFKDQFAALRPGLVAVALDLEILDPRETRYVLANPEDAFSDLQMLRRRFQELADAPRVSDALRFPDRTMINELLSFNRAYRNHVEMRQPLEMGNGGYLRGAQREVDYLYQVWDTARDARCEYYYVTVRRQALKRLREMLGEDAYYQGRLPSHVPVWRFEPIQ